MAHVGESALKMTQADFEEAVIRYAVLVQLKVVEYHGSMSKVGQITAHFEREDHDWTELWWRVHGVLKRRAPGLLTTQQRK